MATTRLVQLSHPARGRRIALVQEPRLVLLQEFDAVYHLALAAIQSGSPLTTFIRSRLTDETLDYDDVYHGNGEWRLLPSFDHPADPFACLVSGTGLTHRNSALHRQMMHIAKDAELTDSMRMYQWGVDGGRPAPGAIGVQPEWFYKGNGAILRAHGQPLDIPPYAKDGGEEPEVAGAYVVDPAGQPWRIGLTTGNEFSDHVMERQNYLYLAPSKLRTCAIGPELVVDAGFDNITGTVRIFRNDREIWSRQIHTGEQHMAHSLLNLEHHHFKYAAHRMPLQAHVHFFGADAFSFGSQVMLEQGDRMHVHWEGLGRALESTLHKSAEQELPVQAKPLT